MRIGIPSTSSAIRPLENFLEMVYQHAAKHSGRSIANMNLSKIGWSSLEEDAIALSKQVVRHQVTLWHWEVEQRLCGYTDASNIIWPGIVNQITPPNMAQSHVEKSH